MSSSLPENPYTRRLRRMLRARQALAAGLVVAAVGVAAVYGWERLERGREARAHPAPKAPLVGLKIEQTAGGVTISKSEGGRPVFRVFAQRADKLRQGGRDLLHQVRILVYAEDGVHADEISGEDFGYNEVSGDLSAEGEVQIALQGRPASRGEAGAPIEITARGLTYNVKRGTGSIAQGIEFSMGGARGSAGSATLDSHAGRADFAGGITLQWRRPAHADLVLHSATAWVEREAGTNDAAQVHFEGTTEIRQGAESLRAARMDLKVRSDQTLSDFRASGDVEATEDRTEGAIEAQAQEVNARFADDGYQTLSGLELGGGVEIRERASGGNRSLHAARMRVEVDGNGDLTRLVASQDARLDLSGQPSAQLAAPELDFTFAGAANGTGARLPRLAAISSAQGRAQMRRGEETAEADRVTIALDGKQQPQFARADGDVRASGQAGSLRSQALDLRFAAAPSSGNPQLAEAVAQGRVQIADGDRYLSADRLHYDAASGTTICTGQVVAGDASARLSAPALTFVSGAEGSERVMATEGVAASLLPGAGGAALPNANPREPVAVTARSLMWNGRQGKQKASGTAVFEDGVRVMQAPNLLRADRLQVDADREQLFADGHVRTSAEGASGQAPGMKNQGAVTVAAERLEYDGTKRIAVYEGNVTMLQAGSRLAAPRLEVQLGTKGLEQAVASEGVQVSQPGRQGRAETVSYQFADGLIRMSGGIPSILDAEQGKISGDPLTFSIASDEIQVGSKTGVRATGRTVVHK